jgi:hypothetical protein
MGLFRNAYTGLFIFYNKFQTIILSIFVFGVIDLLLYSDILMASIMIPEFTPLIVAVVFVYGLYKYFKYWKGKR